MGTYTSLTVDGYEIVSTKSWADNTVMTIFSETDRYCIRRAVNVLAGDVASEDEEIQVGYRAPGWVIRDRLEAIGFTLSASRSIFEKGKRTALDELQALSETMGVADSMLAEFWANKIAVLEDLSFDVWLREFSALKCEGIHSWHLSSWSENPVPKQVSAVAQYMLSDSEDSFFGYSCPDIRYFLRAVIEACGENTLWEQDLSAVMYAGWYDFDDSVVENARAGLISDFPRHARIIILTEGSSDRHAIEGALKLIYPHLVDLYSFIDFDGPGAKGGADQLVHTLKAFMGSGIANRVIALFDNDTGALSALRNLKLETLPASMRVIHYPPLEIAKRYPTMGPSGLVEMDVNGLAGSLEMYFGEDLLRQEDGSMIPVQWKGYDSTLRQYQGELMNKAKLQSAFFTKLDKALSDPSIMKTQDWSGILLILDAIRAAFATRP